MGGEGGVPEWVRLLFFVPVLAAATGSRIREPVAAAKTGTKRVSRNDHDHYLPGHPVVSRRDRHLRGAPRPLSLERELAHALAALHPDAFPRHRKHRRVAAPQSDPGVAALGIA